MKIQVDIKAIADCLQVIKVSVLEEIVIVEDILLFAKIFESYIFFLTVIRVLINVVQN